MKIWQYINQIIYSLAGLFFIGAIISICYNLIPLNLGIQILLDCVIEGGIIFALPRLIDGIKVKHILSENGTEIVNLMNEQSENKALLPFEKVKVENIRGKEAGDYNYVLNNKFRVILVNDNLENLNFKLIITILRKILPKTTDKKILDEECFRALYLYVAYRLAKDPEVIHFIKGYIDNESNKNKTFKDWSKKFENIDSAHIKHNSKKNLLFQFLLPKLECIAKFEEFEEGKKEAERLIYFLSRFKLDVIFVYAGDGKNQKGMGFLRDEDSLRGKYIEKIKERLDTYKRVIVTGRGSYIKFVNSIVKNIKESEKVEIKEENDIWNFPDGRKSTNIRWFLLTQKDKR